MAFYNTLKRTHNKMWHIFTMNEETKIHLKTIQVTHSKITCKTTPEEIVAKIRWQLTVNRTTSQIKCKFTATIKSQMRTLSHIPDMKE